MIDRDELTLTLLLHLQPLAGQIRSNGEVFAVRHN